MKLGFAGETSELRESGSLQHSEGMKRHLDLSRLHAEKTFDISKWLELHLLICEKERRGGVSGTLAIQRMVVRMLSTTSICSVSRSGFLRTMRPCYVP